MLEALAGSAFTLALGGWLFAYHLWKEVKDLQDDSRDLYRRVAELEQATEE